MDVLLEGDRCRLEILADLRILLDEAGDATGGEPGPIAPDEQLAVAMRPRSDRQRRDRELLGDLTCGIRRHHLEHDSEGTRCLDRPRICEQLCHAVVAAALDHVPAESVLGLRREADVREHGDAGLDDATDLLGHTHSALELDGVRTGLLHVALRGVERLLGPRLVGAEGQICDHERTLRRSSDGGCQRDHLVDRDRQRRLVAEDGVARRVADQQKVDAGAVEDRRRQEVVARQARDADALALRAAEVPHADPLRRRGLPGSVGNT